MDVQVEAALRTAATILPGTPVLEVGLGDPALAIGILRLSIQYSGCDADPRTVEAMRRRIESSTNSEAVVEAFIGNAIPFPDAAFDWIFVSDWDRLGNANESPAELCSELHRTLRMGGWIWIGFQANDSIEAPQYLHRAGFVSASTVTSAGLDGTRNCILRKIDATTPV